MATSDLWSEVLKTLLLQMTKATFETWLKNTTAQEEEDGRLIVFTPSSFAQDWLDNRMRDTIERATVQVAGRPLLVEVRLTDASRGGYQPEMFWTGDYKDAYNALTQPDLIHYTTQYFHRQWLPLLGLERWHLIWEMRTRCYWNKKTGQKRDTFEATYPELAAAIGVSTSTVKRMLSRKDPKADLLARFITRLKTKRRYSNYRSGTVNETSVWQVRLDDPLTPEDEQELERRLKLSKCQNDP
jgi:chromosomal replication initiation ATPase DnaA